ncbi:hypothetical protein B7494_g2798 [Chlorociboria aeruginascens]|nr:hypothetical protein B7494_g2798 [Chlorociboria aeruginascens]
MGKIEKITKFFPDTLYILRSIKAKSGRNVKTAITSWTNLTQEQVKEAFDDLERKIYLDKYQQMSASEFDSNERTFLEVPGSPKFPEDSHIFLALISALDTLQTDYFAVWQGLYPTGIDWTSAVLATYVSGSLSTLSTSNFKAKVHENLINKHFTQLTAYYFGQDAFGLRQEAYDDMLWVVLGWLESIKFIDLHSETQYASHWYGEQYTSAFAHRARIFWELASRGWDTKLCNGGMLWSPYLLPYKNAITNELYIAASISMYLFFPGDTNSSPFLDGIGKLDGEGDGKHDPRYLAAAIQGYKWLNNSNMTNPLGLYIDGYHISNLDWKPKNGTRELKCDARNEMVYTYNQGVLLSGQRGLYEATGARSYLEDGHSLIRNVIAATGFNLKTQSPFSLPEMNGESRTYKNHTMHKWYGLGRNGIIEDTCDEDGYCSQDGQTFKGIFFHHLTAFCNALPRSMLFNPETEGNGGYQDDRRWHGKQCKRYRKWIHHNARAALSTQDKEGKFGMWWGAPSTHNTSMPTLKSPKLHPGSVDYRNLGVPDEESWTGSRAGRPAQGRWDAHLEDTSIEIKRPARMADPNNRGRGRTAETQGGGVAVLRAAWEVGREEGVGW